MKGGIICSLDGVANSVRAIEVKKFLERNGHNIKLINTYERGFAKFLSSKNNLFKLKVISSKFGLSNYPLIDGMKIRADILEKEIKKERFDFLICENAADSYVLMKDLGCLKIFDCPTPFVEELRYGKEFSSKYIDRLRELEISIYEKSDYLTFIWESYVNYVKKNIYGGKNFFILNYGCHPKKQRAEFRSPPKIIYLGDLSGYWINKPLLTYLAQITTGSDTSIDVYGKPKPEKKQALNYKGYHASSVLKNYQFGLITITEDPLRCEGFSCKHTEYLSYGLPTLVPKWRNHLEKIKGTIPYDKHDFMDQLRKYSNEDEWQRMSDKAYEQAKKLDWNITLRPLLKIISK